MFVAGKRHQPEVMYHSSLMDPFERSKLYGP